MQTQPYTYLIGWTAQDRWYVGIQFRSGCNPANLWKTYFTSSKSVRAFAYLHGDPDVIRTFPVEDKHAALCAESGLLIYLDAVASPRYLNRCRAGVHFAASSKPKSPEHIAKVAKARKGTKWTEEQRARHRVTMKGKGVGTPKPGTAQKLRGRKQAPEVGLKKRETLMKTLQLRKMEKLGLPSDSDGF